MTLRNRYHNQTNHKMTQVSTKHPSLLIRDPAMKNDNKNKNKERQHNVIIILLYHCNSAVLDGSDSELQPMVCHKKVQYVKVLADSY